MDPEADTAPSPDVENTLVAAGDARVTCAGCDAVLAARVTRELAGIVAGSLCRDCTRPGHRLGHARWTFR